MKICFIADINLPDNKDAIQYHAFEWALSDTKKKKTDFIVFLGNIGTKDALPYFYKKMESVSIPYLCLPENKDGFKALDPDMAEGENPSITFYNSKKNEYRKMFYFCPVPTDLNRYLTTNKDYDSIFDLDSKTPLYEINDSVSAYRISSPITDIHKYSSFFKCYLEGKIKKAPLIVSKENLKFLESYIQKRVFDIHSHTYYSKCGRDNPRDLIDTAIKNGISVIGISDHGQDFTDRKAQYREEIRAIAEEYKDKITVLLGIELPTRPHSFSLNNSKNIEDYDYCLVEHLTEPLSIIANSFWDYRKKLGKYCGIAHTDLFQYCDMYGYEYEEFFKKMAEENVFWEMNVNYDTIHKYMEYQYVFDFMNDPKKLDIIRNTGVYISIGLDCHNYEDYYGYNAHKMYDFLKANNIKTADMLIINN